MTINEILSEVTILKDCSTTLLKAYIVLVILSVAVAIVCTWLFIDHWGRGSIGRQFATIAMAVVGVAGAVSSIILCNMYPVNIDYYVSVNDVEIEQLTEYFDISELSQIDDMTVCHITPKSEYYIETLEIRVADKETENERARNQNA